MSRRRRVAIVLPSLFHIGAQLYVVNLSRRLECIGHECTFVLMSKSGALVEDVSPERVICFGARLFRHIPIVRLVESVIRLAILLSERRFDTILTVTPFLNRVACALKLCGILRERLVIESHQYPPRELAADYSPLSRRCYERTFWLYKYADKHRTLSVGTHAFFRALGHTNVQLYPNLIDISRIIGMSTEPPTVDLRVGGFVVVSLGRLTKQKNLRFLIERVSALARKRGGRLWVIGDGEERSDLVQFVKANGYADYVTFTGAVGNPYALLKQADVFELTSFWEGRRRLSKRWC